MKKLLLGLIGLLFIMSCANLDKTQIAPKTQTGLNLMDDGIMSIRKREFDKGLQMLQQHLKAYPKDEKWLNIWLGYCYFMKEDYKMAEKHYLKATWYEHSEIDGLWAMEYIIPYTHLLPKQQIKDMIGEYWKRIRNRLPHSEYAISHYYWRTKLDKSIIQIDRFMPEERDPALSLAAPNEPIVEISGGGRGFFRDRFKSDIPKDEFKNCLSIYELIQNVIEAKEKKWLKGEMDYYKWTAYEYQLSYLTPEYLKEERAEESDYCISMGVGLTEFEKKYYNTIDYCWQEVEPMFMRLADCFIQQAENEKQMLIKTSQIKDEEEKIKQEMLFSKWTVENYKMAIYYLHRSYYYFADQSYMKHWSIYDEKKDEEILKDILKQITLIRRKIKELETQLNPQKDSPSLPK